MYIHRSASEQSGGDEEETNLSIGTMNVDLRILLILSCLFILLRGNNEKNDSAFVPTREWQVVEKGTSIPKGLHVRHNFQTGITEAKLLDEGHDGNADKKTSSRSLSLHPDEKLNADVQDETKPAEKVKMSLEELKKRLKKLQSDELKNDENSSENKETKKEFRSYDEIKKELKSLKINVTNEADIISGYFEKFQVHRDSIVSGNLNNSKIEEILFILDKLEFFIHFIDNAQLFADMGGMTKIISPCLNSTIEKIKLESLNLLGAAVQSNPKVQTKALENDYVQKLLHILVTNSKLRVRSRCMFALSALVRQFPAAQKALVDHGGLEIFGKLLDEDQQQIQIRVMNLMNDLLLERKSIEEISSEKDRELRLQAYSPTKFERKLLMHNYCSHLINLMSKNIQALDNFENITNEDLFHAIFESTLNFSGVCREEFEDQKEEIMKSVAMVLRIYQSIDPDAEIVTILEKLASFSNRENKPRDEL